MILAAAVLLFQLPVISGSSPASAHAGAPFAVSPVAGGTAAVPGGTAWPRKGSNAHAAAKASPTALDGSTEPSKASSAPDRSTSQPGTPASLIELPNPAFSAIYLPPPSFQPETPPIARPSHAWFILALAEHSAAGFDAWSTRAAVAQGRVEADPLMRPFAHSGAIYGAIQVLPLGLDYVAHRMQRSSGWSHRIWWVPQGLATAAFVFSGTYNFAHLK
jgi:hypothetical protein